MSEPGEFIKPRKIKGTKVNIDKSERIDVSSVEGQKDFVEISVSGNRSGTHEKVRKVTPRYVIRHISERAKYENSASEVLKKYQWLKDNELPVLPMVRFDWVNRKLLMSDATQNGKYKLLTKHQFKNWKGEIKNFGKVSEECQQIAKNAYHNGHGVFLGSDAYALQVDDKSIAHVLLLDLGLNSYFLDGGFKPEYELFEEMAVDEANNFLNLVDFILGDKKR